MEEKIQQSVKITLQKSMVNYERVLNQFQKFFDQEELQKVLDGKANLNLIQYLDENKVNKIEHQKCLQMIESIYERIKHIAILQVETARSLMPQKNANNFEKTESFNSKMARRDYLFKLS